MLAVTPRLPNPVTSPAPSYIRPKKRQRLRSAKNSANTRPRIKPTPSDGLAPELPTRKRPATAPTAGGASDRRSRKNPSGPRNEEPAPQTSTLVLPAMPSNELTVLMDEENDGLYDMPSTQRLVQIANLAITAQSLRTLRSPHWLDDTAIMAYLQLVTDRPNELSYAYTSPYLYPALLNASHDYVYSPVAMDYCNHFLLDDTDVILLPIHTPGHWALVAVYVRTGVITHFNSAGPARSSVTDIIKAYMSDLWNYHNGSRNNMPDWTAHVPTGYTMPKQGNSYDCGVYVCLTADFLTQQLPPHQLTPAETVLMRQHIGRCILLRQAPNIASIRYLPTELPNTILASLPRLDPTLHKNLHSLSSNDRLQSYGGR